MRHTTTDTKLVVWICNAQIKEVVWSLSITYPYHQQGLDGSMSFYLEWEWSQMYLQQYYFYIGPNDFLSQWWM